MMISLNGPPAETWQNEDAQVSIDYWRRNFNTRLE